jgi:hypothetical protein
MRDLLHTLSLVKLELPIPVKPPASDSRWDRLKSQAEHVFVSIAALGDDGDDETITKAELVSHPPPVVPDPFSGDQVHAHGGDFKVTAALWHQPLEPWFNSLAPLQHGSPCGWALPGV